MSALDGRIRSIAREEAAAALSEGPAAGTGNSEVAELRATVEDLTARLEALESAPAPTATATKRTSRKTAEHGE